MQATELEKNICDTVKEWEIKIGYRSEAVELYYPGEALEELLHTDRAGLEAALKRFQEDCRERLGAVGIRKTSGEDRWCVRISPQGTAYVHTRVEEPKFLKAFLALVTSPGKKLEDAEALFRSYSDRVEIRKQGREWSFWFSGGEPDAFVYHVEETPFGIEYHRFTREAYDKLFF